MEKVLERKAGTSNYVLQRILQNRFYSGTRLPEEIIELEQNLRAFIEYGQITYNRVEDFLNDLGYRRNNIRDMFRKITGIDPRQFYYERMLGYLDTPPTIPGLNYGWGISKDKKFDYYFIMPWLYGYCLFGQKGDLERKEVDYLYTLEDVKKALKDKVKDTKDFYATLNESILNKIDIMPLTDILVSASDNGEFKKVYTYLKQTELNKKQKRDFLDYVLAEKKIDDKEYSKLAYTFLPEIILENEEVEYIGETNSSFGFEVKKGDIGKIERLLGENTYKIIWGDNDDNWSIETGDCLKFTSNDKLLKAEDDEKSKDKETLMQEPMEKELEEKTPQQFFDQQLEKEVETVAPAQIQRILDYLKEKDKHISDFTFEVSSFKYISWDNTDDDDIQKTVTPEAPGPLTSDAIVVCLLEITESATGKMKPGMIVFFVTDDEITSTDLIKGRDNLTWGLTDLGLQEYFAKD